MKKYNWPLQENAITCGDFEHWSHFQHNSGRFVGASCANLLASGPLFRTKIYFHSPRTMKFTGLILICATSCLALILPAIGVVQFPKSQMTNPAAPPGFLTNAPQNQNNPVWNPAVNRQDFSSSSNVMPNPSTPFPNQPLPSYNQTTPMIQQPSQPQVAPQGNKLGMGIWLMLAPVCLLGLAMWTFAPNPSGSPRQR